MSGRRTPMGRALAALAALAALGIAVAAGSGPADAQAWAHAEPGHDAVGFRFDPDPAPCGTEVDVHDSLARRFEIRSESVSWGQHDIRLTLRFADLQLDRTQGTSFHLRTDGGDYELDVDGLRHGKPSVFLGDEPVYSTPDACGFSVGSSEGLPCAGAVAQISPAHEVIKVALPPERLTNPHWVRVGAETYGYHHEVSYYDRWAPVGTTAHGFAGPYGPQVRPSVPVDQPVGAGSGARITGLTHEHRALMVGHDVIRLS